MVSAGVGDAHEVLKQVDVDVHPWRRRAADLFEDERYEFFRERSTYVRVEGVHSEARDPGTLGWDVSSGGRLDGDLYDNDVRLSNSLMNRKKDLRETQVSCQGTRGRLRLLTLIRSPPCGIRSLR